MSFIDAILCKMMPEFFNNSKNNLNDPIKALYYYKDINSHNEKQILKSHLEHYFKEWEINNIIQVFEWQKNNNYLIFLKNLYDDLQISKNTNSWKFQEYIIILVNKIEFSLIN